MKLKKNLKTIAVLASILMLVFGTLSVSAAGYRLSVYSGNGSFGGSDVLEGSSASVDTGAATVTVDGGEAVTITMPDNKSADDSKYFIRGLKVSGHDNDEVIVGNIDLSADSSPVKHKDAEVVVAYGLKSNMAAYTIRYINGNSGDALLAEETHYGVTGDKPIVSYKYVDGYLPNAWNETARIAADGSTVFTFYYYEVDAEGNVIIINDGAAAGADGAAGAGAGAAGNGAANGAANADGTTIGDNATPLADGPADIVDLDDNSTPLSDGAEAEEEPDHGINGGLIAGAVAVVAIAAGAYAIYRRRNYEYVDDDEEE